MRPALPTPAPRLRAAAKLTLGALVTLLVPGTAGAEGGSPQARLRAALEAGQADALSLTWSQGADGAGSRLVIEGGQARALRCTPECTAVGKPLPLSAGEKAVVISGLRSLGLESLRSADEAALADRALELSVSGTEVGRWQRPRGDWPAPPSGEGLSQSLDELLLRIERTAVARRPVPIPQTTAELMGMRLKLQVSPNKRPGGIVIIEGGSVRVLPEEGSLPRVPRPRAFERPLREDEAAQILAAVQKAEWDRLEEAVPRRAQPAIGDDDGRLATLHLMLADAAPGARALPSQSAGSGAVPGAADQPRGLKRYVADLQRSPAAPLLSQLMALLSPSGSEAPPSGPPRKDRQQGAGSLK